MYYPTKRCVPQEFCTAKLRYCQRGTHLKSLSSSAHILIAERSASHMRQAKQISISPLGVIGNSLMQSKHLYLALTPVSSQSYLSAHVLRNSPMSALPPGIPYSPFLGPSFSCTRRMLWSRMTAAPQESEKLVNGGIIMGLVETHLYMVMEVSSPLYILYPCLHNELASPIVSRLRLTQTALGVADYLDYVFRCESSRLVVKAAMQCWKWDALTSLEMLR